VSAAPGYTDKDGLAETLEALGADMHTALDDLAPVALVVDRGGIVRWLNPAGVQLLGDVRGRHFSAIVAPDFAHEARRRFARKILGAVRSTGDVAALIDREGERIPVGSSSVALTRGRSVVGVFGILWPTRPPAPAVRSAQLTPRQAEVLRHLAAGASTAQIASALGLSSETVRNHVRGALRALGEHSRLGAVVRARELGLVG
jgi:DNA-binding CsgD family transcriptional regulator